MRPINNVVDATNYAMLEIGEPLHAFDYDVLVQRAGQAGNLPHITIITRTAESGEILKTLDGVERELDSSTVLVCDTAGALSIAGVMGGAASEVSATTRNVLLEGAAWNFTNIRRTARAQNLPSEASFRFSRGVHPAMAERGVRRCLEYLRQWTGGVVAQGLVDNYPLPPIAPTIEITPADVQRTLGIELSAETIAEILASLEFRCSLSPASLPAASRITATAPDHRLDIGEGVIGKADLIEEIARIYGYERIPETRLADELPPQRDNPALENEERLRDVLVNLGLQEVFTHRLTSPEREARRLPSGEEIDDKPYIQLANPIATNRTVLRHSLLACVLEIAEHNARLRERLALFEIAPIFIESEDSALPDEIQRLVIVLAGPRARPGWQEANSATMEFYDLKGIIAALLERLHIGQFPRSERGRSGNPTYEPCQHPTFHPGKCARLLVGEQQLGVFGEVHPLVRAHYDLPVSYAHAPLLAADFDLEALLSLVHDRYDAQSVPEYPPVLEDLAIVVDEDLPAERVAEVMRTAGGKTVVDVRLFDLYRGEKIGAGKKSLAYRLTYQADKTLTDEEVAKIRQKIVRTLERDVGARLRG